MIPVPLPGLLSSVRALAPADLFLVVNRAYKKVDSGKSWPPDALRAYGVAACREIEHRGLEFGLTDVQVATLCGGYPRGVRRVMGRVPSVVVGYVQPSWMKFEDIHVRHRASLLMGPNAAFYREQGWREQLDIEGAIYNFALPPHDPRAPVVRWRFDTSKDW